MALDVKFDIEIRQTGADTNAGGFARGSYISPPAAPTISNSGSGGSVAANTYYCVVTYSDASGETIISPQSSTTTSGGSSTITVNSPIAVTGAINWNCYIAIIANGPYFPQGTALTIGSNRTITTTPPTSGTQPRGVDYSQQNSPQVNVADGVANGTTTFTSATAGFTGSHVGNLIRVGTSLWRHIVGINSSTSITLDASVSSASSLPVVIGGAFATPGMLGAIVPQQDSTGFLKYSATIYTMSNSNNVSGGNLSLGGRFNLIGYDTNRSLFNNDANRPTIKPTVNSTTMLNCSDQDMIINNIAFTNPDNKTGCTCFNGGNVWVITNCKINNYNIFHNGANYCIYSFLDVSVVSGAALGSFTKMTFCDWHDGGSIQVGQGSCIMHNNIYNITGSTRYALQLNSDSCIAMNNNFNHITTNDGSLGSVIQANKSCLVINNHIEDVNPTSVPGYAFDALGFSQSSYQQCFINNFTYNIKTAIGNPANVSPDMIYNHTSLTGSSFNSSSDLGPSVGSDVRSASLPIIFPAGTTNNHLDAGAVQSASSGDANVVSINGTTFSGANIPASLASTGLINVKESSGTYDIRQVITMMWEMLMSGQISGLPTSPATVRNFSNTQDRAHIAFDSNNNRTSFTVNNAP